MNQRRMLVLAAMFVVAACSGSSSDSESSSTSPAGTESADTEPADTQPSETQPADTAADTEPPADTTAPASTESDGGVPDTEADPPLVIDGPAQVVESCDSLPRGVTEFELEAGGAVHDVRIFVPDTVVADPAPTVLNWHGLGSNGAEQAAFSGYEAVADEEGFIVVHATGVAADGDDRNSWELAQRDRPERDDLAFADALIDEVVADWCGDPLRIYSTGMSNGGFFTSELVCHRAGRIAAAVSVAGTSHSETCAPERAVPYASFHGTDDAVVPYAGGTSTIDEDAIGDTGFFDQVMPEEFAEFAADAGCDEPTRTDVTPEVIRYDYAGCADGVPMTFYELPGSGHIWPNSPVADQIDILGYFTKDIDASADGWAFMSQHSL